jgi:transcription elongation factor GreA
MSVDNTETTQKVLSEGAQTLLKNLQNMLNEEKWTRATLSNYSTNQFKELDLILKDAIKEYITDELKKDCDEHLTHTRNSIIANYLSGMVSLSRQIIDDSAMVNLVSIFLDNHKWSIVKYLCDRILDYGESKYALRTLADCYKNDNEEELLFGVWERLVKADSEEADLAKALAEHNEKNSNMEVAIDFYKKAIHRYINKSQFANVRDIWEKLLAVNTRDIEFFLHIQKKIAKIISEDKAVELLNKLYLKYQNIDIETAVNILKIILQYDEKDVSARREIIECFRKKYASHSQLEEYIRISNLSQNYRDVHKAISDFEKHIAFDKGNFVYHRTWGVGRIAGIQGDEIRIDFSKKRDHTMSLKMAVDALATLSKDHIWVLKATRKKEELREKVKGDFVWTLKTVIKSFENSCDLKRIKAELSPALLSPGEWTSWSGKARDILKNNPDFGVSPDNIDIFTVRDRSISVTEKLYNEFNAEKDFFDKASTIRDFVTNKDADKDSDNFREMVSYFTACLPSSAPLEQIIASWLLIKELSSKVSGINAPLNISFSEIFLKIKDLPAVFKNLKDAKFHEEFLLNIKTYISDWPSIYIKLFPYALTTSIICNLEKEGYTDKLTVMTSDCFDRFRDNREAVVWLYKNSRDTSWFKETNIPYEKQLITLINILDLSYRDIDNHRDTAENRKINKLVYTILFKEDAIASYIENADEDTIIRIDSFINDVSALDPQDKLNLRSRILDRHPSIKLIGEKEKKVTRSLTVTQAKLVEKQKQLSRIMDVEVPANSKEIEYALSLGDLRENAEYKAAKEKQEQLNTQVAKLKEDIERAQLFDPNSVNTSKVSFGTKVQLLNETKDKYEEYTILGPWESDPDNNIISYLSPLGSAILNRKEEERFEFDINNERSSFVVKQISAVNI